MDILAHALWAGAGVMVTRRRWSVPSSTGRAIVALAVIPDLLHLLPVVGWSLFGAGSAATLVAYLVALPGQVPIMPDRIGWLTHNLHCITHSAVVLGLLTLLACTWVRWAWMPLLGWWSHVLIDVFTHSRDFYPSPVLWPFTREGFDGVAWNSPSFMVLNYLALAVSYLWLLRCRWCES